MVDNMTQGNKKKRWYTTMWDFLTRPGFAQADLVQMTQSRMLAAMTLIISVLAVLGALAGYMSRPNSPDRLTNFSALAALAGGSLLVYILSRTRLFRLGAVILLAAFSLLSHMSAMMGINSTAFALSILPMGFIISIALLPIRGILIFTAANFLIAITLPLFFRQVTWEYSWTISGIMLVLGGLLLIVVATRQAIERERLNEMNRINQKLTDLSSSLEQRVDERTRDIALAAEVGRRVSGMHDINALLTEAVTLIRERFNLYYTQIYLSDALGRVLILRAGTGEVGKELLERSHRLVIDLNSIDGTAAVERRSIIVPDTQHSSMFRSNVLLPETRSEMAIPLISGERVLGVLDLQSSIPGGLKEENLAVFETLAAQLATAIDNAELFQRVEHTLSDVEARSRLSAREGWQSYQNGIETREQIGYVYDQRYAAPSEGPFIPDPKSEVLSTPIQISGEQIGSFQFEADHAWSADDKALVQTVAQQVAQQVENLRLLYQAQRFQREAQDAVRRLTGEEWSAHLSRNETEQIAYVYADGQVKHARAGQNNREGAQQFEIKVQDQSIGQFGVLSKADLSPEDQALVRTVSEQLGAHLENMRLFTAAQQELEERKKAEETVAKRAAELAKVADTATVVATLSSPEEMLQTVVDLVKTNFNLYHTHIYTLNDTGDMLVLTKGAGEVGHRMVAEGRSIAMDSEKSLVARAARLCQGVIVNDVRQDPEFLPHPLLPNTKSEMAIPMIAGDRLLGVLDIQDQTIERFSLEDVNIMTTLAAQIAVSLQNARSYVRAQRQAEREALINAISERIQATNSVEGALQVAVREIGRALGAQHTAIRLGLERNNGDDKQ